MSPGPDAVEPGSGTDDRALLHRHIDGDPDAFNLLVRRHSDRLWAVALRTTGNPEDAADALQNALVSAFRRAEGFRGEAKVTTWLHRIVVNACLDIARGQRSRRTEPLPEREDSPQAISAVEREDPVEVTQRRADVLAALNQLKPEQRAALVLVDMEGYSVEEAAAMLDCPAGTVKSRCARGRGRLAPLLASYRRNPSPAANVPPPRRVATDTPRSDPTHFPGGGPPEPPGSEGRRP